MLQYLINVTNTLFPTLLLIGLLAGLFRLFKLPSLKRVLLAGFFTGAAVALVLAVLRLNTGFVIRELYNAPVLLLILIAEILLFIQLQKRAELSKKQAGRLGFIVSFACFAYVMPDIYLYPFEFNVGMDSVCNIEFLHKVIGYLIALILTVLSGLSIYKLSYSLDKQRLKTIFLLALSIMFAFHLLLLVQISVLRGWLPSYSWLIALVMRFLQHQVVFMYGMLFIAAYTALSAIRQNRAFSTDGANPAIRRQQKADSKRQTRWGALLLINAFAVLFILTVGVELSNRIVELAPPVELMPEAEKIAIPVETVNDGHLHRFSYTAEDGTQVRYIVIRKSESAYGVGLDACDVCGPSGYYERNGQIVCILCDVVMNISTIGFKGGCNPVPLEFVMEDGKLIIKTAELESEAHRFR